MIIFNILLTILIYGIPILLAVSLHEVAHGWVALKLGDSTAKMLGRLTLNPIKHIDPIGTILVPFVLFQLGGFIFGWAKPVPITWQNLNNPRRDIALVAVAGPLANLLMAFCWGILFKLAINFDPQNNSVMQLLLVMSQVGVMINFLLMVLNMLPIPPLDGSRVLSSVISPRYTRLFANLEVYGFLILVLLLASGLLTAVLKPMIEYLLMMLQYILAI